MTSSPLPRAKRARLDPPAQPDLWHGLLVEDVRQVIRAQWLDDASRVLLSLTCHQARAEDPGLTWFGDAMTLRLWHKPLLLKCPARLRALALHDLVDADDAVELLEARLALVAGGDSGGDMWLWWRATLQCAEHDALRCYRVLVERGPPERPYQLLPNAADYGSERILNDLLTRYVWTIPELQLAQRMAAHSMADARHDFDKHTRSWLLARRKTAEACLRIARCLLRLLDHEATLWAKAAASVYCAQGGGGGAPAARRGARARRRGRPCAAPPPSPRAGSSARSPVDRVCAARCPRAPAR